MTKAEQIAALQRRVEKIEKRKTGITEKDIEAICAGFAPVVQKYVDAATAPLLRRIEELEQARAASGE